MNYRTRTVLLAATLATPLFAGSVAHAQFRVDNSNVNDANNQIGSGGYNGGHVSNSNSFNNDIINNDVTGGKGFQGSIPYFAPGAFHGNLAGSLQDSFVARSTSAYNNNSENTHAFYGQSYGAPPPPGFVANPNASNAFTPAPPPVQASNDTRLGVINNDPIGALPRPGELMLSSQVDTSGTAAPIGTSALTGQPTDDTGADDTRADDSSALSRFSNMRRTGINNRLGDDQTVQSMREELRKNIVTDNPADNSDNSANPNSPNGATPADGAKPAVDPNNFSANAKIGAPFESPTSTDLPNKPLGSSLSGTTALDNSIKSDQSTVNQLVPAPAEQSSQYAELSKRFNKLQVAGLTDQQQNDKFQQQFKQRQAADLAKKTATANGNTGEPGLPGQANGPGGMLPAASAPPIDSGTAPALPPATGTPSAAGQPSAKPAAAPAPAEGGVAAVPAGGDAGPQIDTNSSMVRPGQPLMIKSLTDGMKPGRLRDLLASAEDEMHQGRFTSSLDQYDLAERVVPNNPMIALGRANAELGASYYARADNDIRRAFKADGALMLGQFNLQQFIGSDRVNFLVKDLKDIANTEPTSVRAPFLLAYIEYNTGDRKMASDYLAMSEQRAGQPDPLFKQLRVYWDLPAPDAVPAPDAGK